MGISMRNINLASVTDKCAMTILGTIISVCNILSSSFALIISHLSQILHPCFAAHAAHCNLLLPAAISAAQATSSFQLKNLPIKLQRNLGSTLSRTGFPIQLKSKEVEIGNEKMSQMIIKEKLSERAVVKENGLG